MAGRVLLIGALIALCAILGVLLLYLGGQQEEAAKEGEFSPPPLPEGSVSNATSQGEGNESIYGIFAGSEEIQPPSLPF